MLDSSCMNSSQYQLNLSCHNLHSSAGHFQDVKFHIHRRLSYLFGLMGPCISTDTACSSSLVAAHLAHRGLLAGEATHAVAAGVNLALSPTTTVAICQLQALSVVGRCR